MTNAPRQSWQYGESESVGPGRVSLIGRAVKTWTGQLVDLGGRNTLLYYRDLKQGTLDIGPGSGANAVAVGDLLSSRTVRLSLMFGDAAIAAAARRARTVKAKATENYEERGLQTLFLAWGVALNRKNALGGVPCRLSGGQRAMRSMCYFKIASGRRAEGQRMEAISVTQGEISRDTALSSRRA